MAAWGWWGPKHESPATSLRSLGVSDTLLAGLGLKSHPAGALLTSAPPVPNTHTPCFPRFCRELVLHNHVHIAPALGLPLAHSKPGRPFRELSAAPRRPSAHVPCDRSSTPGQREKYAAVYQELCIEIPIAPLLAIAPNCKQCTCSSDYPLRSIKHLVVTQWSRAQPKPGALPAPGNTEESDPAPLRGRRQARGTQGMTSPFKVQPDKTLFFHTATQLSQPHLLNAVFALPIWSQGSGCSYQGESYWLERRVGWHLGLWALVAWAISVHEN